VFILQNGAPVQISFFALEGTLPVGVALLLAAIAGILLVAIPGSVRILQLRRAARRRGPHGRLTLLRLEGRPVPVVGRARVYVCGITPYDTTHLGHAATFVWGDVAARVLRQDGVDVEVCRNVTDVDDVLDAAAARAGSRFDTFAAVQQFRFDRDMAALGVRRPTHEPARHNFVPQVEALAAALLEAEAAYERGGTVWFRGADVAARAGLDATTARALAREFGEDLDDGREDWADVAVWRAAGTGRRDDRARVAQPVGGRAAGLARRVCRDGADDLRAGAGPARRWCGPALPAPRLRSCDGRGRHRGDAVRPRLDAHRHRAGGAGRRWPSRPATSCSWATSSSGTRPRCCGCC
jgi:hypothetical protein